MYSIGVFSKINKITTKTLRHYDEIGLLKPEYVVDMTGYRYYTTHQLPKLHQILALKRMGLSLQQVKEAFQNPDAIDLFLKLKEQDVLNSIKAEEEKLLLIRSYLNLMRGEKMMYNPIIKELPEVIVASMRQVIPNYEALNTLCPEVMGKEMKRVGCVCAVPEYCFNVYHDGEYRETNIDVEICEAVTEMKPNTDILTFKTIPAVPTALCILHKGAYDTLGETYSFAFKWAEENNYEVCDHPRESYIDGIWNKDNVDEWLTELQIPIVQK
ncbi:MerR family transcriptional regulator [Bacillus massiliigorillae]|uniref:MerR family transcriptional regulator n=1 Tax=Bacillus massiliigorillae TaxID=1243664 RepID=UPI0003AAA6B3|nr:MerR family transcriptional regulator [Bacillus massiliigorillae]